MTKRVKKGKMVFVFDLDKTIGYFTQVAIFIEAVENYLKRKLVKNELYGIFDLYPEIFRPDTMTIFKYLKKLKVKLKTPKILIYTNNMGPKSWTYQIKNYIEHKLNYKLFDRTITAWKVGSKVYEKKRTTHNKTYKDLLNAGNLSPNDKICFLDDQNHHHMIHPSINYIHVKAYKHDILFSNMCKKFLKSKLGNLIKKSQHDCFKCSVIEFSKTDPLGFTYIESQISSRKNYDREILRKLKSFVKENKHNISRKKKRKQNKKTRKLFNLFF